MRSTTNYGYGNDDGDEDFSNNTYQSSGGYQSNISDDYLSKQKKTEKTENPKFTSYSSTSSKTSNDPRIGSIKKNYFAEQKRKMNQPDTDEESWFYRVIKQMINYICSGFQSAQTQTRTTTKEKLISFDDDSVSTPKLKLAPKTQKRIDLFKNFIFTKFDKKNIVHERQLYNLWFICFPSDAQGAIQKIDRKWKKIGFQQKDPSTDFRAAGIFGLETMIYFGRKYNSFYLKMLRKTMQDTNGYPFVLAGLNCFLIIMNVLGWTHKSSMNLMARKRLIDMMFTEDIDFKKKEWRYTRKINWTWPNKKNEKNDGSKKVVKEKKVKVGKLLDFGNDDDFDKFESVTKDDKMDVDVENDSDSDYFEEEEYEDRENGIVIFRELFCTTFFILHKEWFTNNATYFMFPKMMQRTTESIELLLETQFYSLEDIEDFNRKAMTKNKKKKKKKKKRTREIYED